MSAVKRFLSAAVLAAAIAAGANLQAQTSAPPPPGPPKAARLPPSNPEQSPRQEARGQGFLEKRFGLSREEAQRRLGLEEQISATGAKLQAQFQEAFLASIIDHTPAYQVTFVFSRQVSADEVRALLPPELRPVFKVKRSRYTGPEIQARQEQVVQALIAAKIAGSVGYDYRTDKFEVTATEEGGQRLLSSLPPELRSDVRFVRGGTPTRVQSGAMPGDSIYGGWMLHQLTSTGATAICTYGFVVKTHEAQPGIVTASAEHCQGQVGIYYDDGHKVYLPTPPVVNKYIYNTNGGRGYDYRVFNTGTLTSGPYVWFWNNKTDSYYQYMGPSGWQQKTWANVNPNYPLEGAYSRVIGVITGIAGTSNVNHPQGAVRCKGGFTTGITCGQVTLSEAAAVIFLDGGATQTFYSYVKIEGTDYMVLSYGGDSGGPVTTEPLWNTSAQYYDVKAAGIIELGSVRDRGDGYDRPCITPDDGACPAYYMPIDRVNDHLGMQIMTTSGGVSPG